MKKILFLIYALMGSWATLAQQPVPPASIREADVLFSKREWRIIDFRQKQNKKAVWPGNPLNKLLYEAVRTGQLKPYLSDSLKSVYSIETFLLLGTEVEYVETPIDPNDPNIVKLDTIYNAFDPENSIKQLIVMEDCIFNKKTSTTTTRIIAIAPLYRNKVAGIDLGLQPLCWLKFDDRFNQETDCRDVLKTKWMFNPENSRSTFSFDDWFAQRLFGSYIIKTSNMYDTSILQDPYYKKNGLEALIEAERLKLQEMERDENVFED